MLWKKIVTHQFICNGNMAFLAVCKNLRHSDNDNNVLLND